MLALSFYDGEEVTSVKFGCSDFLLVFLHKWHINLTMTVLNNMTNPIKDDESTTASEMCEF
jgi:hypothetical protein